MKPLVYLALLLASASALPAQQARVDPSLDRVMATIQSVASLVENFGNVANSPVPAHSASNDPVRNGTAKAAIVRATAGAATGAAIGAMTRKGEKGVVTGAIIGAIAGLVYDRVKVSQERRSELYGLFEPR